MRARAQVHRGGWPIEKTVAKRDGEEDYAYGYVEGDWKQMTGVGGFSLEKSLGPRADHALFTRVGPTA